MKNQISKISFLFLNLALTGCAMKTQPANLFLTEMPSVPVCGDALQSTLGITPMIDRRPEAEKAGKKPGGIFLLLWNQRIGDYMTGNKDFLESVPRTVSEQIGFHLSKTNCFFETRVLNAEVKTRPSPEDLLILLAKEKVHYVLVGELKHLYGKQRQKAYFYLLPALWVNLFGWGNEVGIAEGYAEAFFTLYDTSSGHELWSGKVTGQSDSAVVGSYPITAREALNDASQKLATHLYRFVLLQKGSPLVVSPETV